MSDTFAYLVCQEQEGRITFVNGLWQGTVQIGAADHATCLQSRPMEWDYLQQAGQEGWELVGAAATAMTQNQTTSQVVNKLFFKKRNTA